MTDRQMWDLAVAAVTTEFSLLPAGKRAVVAELTGQVKVCKASLHSIVESVEAGSVCACCGGDCCRSGKYHFTVVDLLVYLEGEKELFAPRFEQNLCPYLGDAGCLMQPGWRPFNCVTFNCENVESLLGQPKKDRLAALERELRVLYARFEELFGNRLSGGLLMNCQRNLLKERRAILKGD